MGRYKCHQCDREFSRSYSLRRHKDSGICRGTQANMLDSDEESVLKTLVNENRGTVLILCFIVHLQLAGQIKLLKMLFSLGFSFHFHQSLTITS